MESNRILIIFVYACTVYLKPCSGEASGTIIPLYIYPVNQTGGNAWQPLLDAYNYANIETWAVVNVNSGPGGATADANYVKAIQQLNATGISTLGYVSTSWTNRSETAVQADIDRWRQLYNTTGIFFDEMATDDDNQKIQYYQNANSYAVSQGFTFTVGNAGKNTNATYFTTVNVVIIYEHQDFPSCDTICSQDTAHQGRTSVSIIPYNVQDLDTTAVSSMKSCAGYIYVTSGSGSNPWGTLPSYLPTLFQVLQG